MLLPGFLLRGGNPVREGGVDQVQKLQCAAEMRFLRSLSPHLNHLALPAAVLAVQDTDAEDCTLCPTAICIFRIKAATLRTCMWIPHLRSGLLSGAPFAARLIARLFVPFFNICCSASDVFPRLPAQMDQTLGRTFFLLYLVLQTEIPDIPIDVGTI